MKIRIGFDLTYDCVEETPMILMLNVHPSRARDLLVPDTLRVFPARLITRYNDKFGNICTRIVAPAGEIRLMTDAVVHDCGKPDPIMLEAKQHPVAELPDEALQFLVASRYCETDRLMNVAWSLFSGTPDGWPRVQAICDFVHSHIRFDYMTASPMKSAYNVYEERHGVCRDFAHLAIAFCRCMNIPARYCTGYLGDIGVPADPAPMDFSAWFEVFLGNRWHTFDARHNIPRIGRIVMARGRDATDVALSTTFGANTLKKFEVTTCELPDLDADTPNVVRLSEKARQRWYGAKVIS